MTAPWLTLIGLGEDGRAGLSPAAIAASGASESRRRRRAAPRAGRAARLRNPVLALADGRRLSRKSFRGAAKKVVVLASGDPFFYGVGSVLARKIPPEEMLCLPAPSVLQPRRGAAGLGAAGLRAGHAAWAPARKNHSASAGWRQNHRPVVGRRHAGQTGRAVDEARFRRIAAHGLRTSWRPARARPRAVWPAIFPSLTSRRLTRSRSISSRIATPASCRARPVSRMIFSSMTARSPRPSSAR